VPNRLKIADRIRALPWRETPAVLNGSVEI
jgi:hypothetical protein